MQSREEILETLHFYIEAGVDEVIGDTPVDQYALSAQPKAAPAQKPSAPTIRASAAIATPAPKAKAPSLNISEEIARAEKLAAEASTLEELNSAIASFNGSALQKMAMNTVFAKGNAGARLMVIDRPPGAEEDRQGIPFAAANGQMLSRMLKAIGIEEDGFYAAACLPWRPPGGQAPAKEDRMLCLPFLKRHIELAAPEMLLLCGEAAAILLEKDRVGINKLRGNWESVEVGDKSIPALPIFHPAFLMDHPASKKLAWRDLLDLKSHLASGTQ
ncbi:uracil-DNA glycosylase [Sneathiella sp. P13V-1]|uniref:uracil-DNA glycosylase n=1 Tax=Sneathiella sp. P13V-1 TaxID=2697366 RepID=UPI00187B6D19|nr:uracil-DNA glycosylase [Sneathiella sp. P13V-1]MBE7635556.1 uracil-DNA glycosylase [Sneathiella sp. P13V-1]